MEGDFQKEISSLLLELSATNDLKVFKHLVEEEGHDVDGVGLWYGRKIGTKQMGFEERTPLMIASMYGSKDILNYILHKGSADVNKASGSDGATALHCAAAGGSLYSHEVIKLLVDSSADVNRVDANGNRPSDLISPCMGFSPKLKMKAMEIVLKKSGNGEDVNGSEKKEYPIDPSLPDIKNGIYGTDEFRMYSFKVKPCSRAYSHDWTECPFVHPGENARRRDPRKYHYSCVPCPEFRKGSCPKGDACEYAHGIFECWLHPAQYRTRLCKDETDCSRRVCFFAHKREELRPLYASTGSGVPSPRSSYSSSPNSFDMASISPLTRGSPSPPLTPNGGSSPIAGWKAHLDITPPTLQLPGSRLKAALCARDLDLETQFYRQQLLDELAIAQAQAQAQARAQQLFSSYSSGLPSSPVRSSPFGIEPCCGSPISNPRSAAFAKRSQSFIDRSVVNGLSGGLSSPAMTMPSHLSDWRSPDGKLDWGFQGDELNKLRKSASFGVRSDGSNYIGGNSIVRTSIDDPNLFVKNSSRLDFNRGGSEKIPPWVEQLYMEQEQMVA